MEILNIFITIFIRVCKYNVVNFEDGRHDTTNGLIAADHCLCAGSGDLYLAGTKLGQSFLLELPLLVVL